MVSEVAASCWVCVEKELPICLSSLLTTEADRSVLAYCCVTTASAASACGAEWRTTGKSARPPLAPSPM